MDYARRKMLMMRTVAVMIVEIVHQLEHIQQTVRRHPKVYIIMVVVVVAVAFYVLWYH